MNYLAFQTKCKEIGITPTSLILNMGLSKGNISSWQKGGNPSVDILIKLSEQLNCTVDYLLTGKKENRPKLTERQNILLDMFDGLNNDGQIKLLETADDMSVSGKYKKHDIVSEVG